MTDRPASTSSQEERDLDLGGRMAFAEAASQKLIPAARGSAGFAGAWIDHRADGALVLSFTTLASSERQRLEALIPEVSRGVRFDTAGQTFEKLRASASRVWDVWGGSASGVDLVGTGVNESTNSIRIYVADGDLAAATVLADRVAAELGVHTEVLAESSGSDVACASRTNCSSPYKAGIRILEALAVAHHAPCPFTSKSALTNMSSQRVTGSPAS